MRKKQNSLISRMNVDIEEYKKCGQLSNIIEQPSSNECIIVLDLRSSPIYKDYSGHSLLCNDIYDFIEDTYSFIKKNVSLSLKILFPENIEDTEKEKIINLIKVHYAISFKEARHDIKKNKIIGWILIGIGAFLFGIYLLCDYYKVNPIINSIIEIFSWVLIWESCDLFVFSNTSKRFDLLKYSRIYNAKIYKDATTD